MVPLGDLVPAVTWEVKERGLYGRCCVSEPQPPREIIDPHLSQSCVQLENLAFAFHLPHADLTGELSRGQAMPLQGESAVQGFLAAIPDMVEGNLLQERWSGLQVRLGTCEKWVWPSLREGLGTWKMVK